MNYNRVRLLQFNPIAQAQTSQQMHPIAQAHPHMNQYFQQFPQ